LGQLVESQLFGVRADDPLVLAGGALVILIAVLVAGIVHGLRPMRIEPVRALRYGRLPACLRSLVWYVPTGFALGSQWFRTYNAVWLSEGPSVIKSNIVCTLILETLLATALSAADRYTIQDLGPISSIRSINQSGQVLASDNNQRPFLYQDGKVRFLPQSSVGPFSANTLNDRGEVVGYVNPPGMYTYYLAIYHHGDLDVRTDVSGVDPVAVNNRGAIAGDLVAKYQPFLYASGTLTAYGPTGTGVGSFTRAINREGEIIGVTVQGSSRLGFIYRNGQFSTFSYPDSSYTEPQAINNEGEIAGMWIHSSVTSFFTQIFTYRDGSFQNLGHVFGESVEMDAAAGINRFGVIVGNGRTLTIPNGGFAAFVYFPREGFQDLNKLIPSGCGCFLQAARGINDRGQIIVDGLRYGARHGFLLTPTYGGDEEENTESTASASE
jgi:uncharacterized membrane protein